MRSSLCAACVAAGRDGCPLCGARPVRDDVDIFAPRKDSAVFSENRVYRYRLERILGPELGPVLVVCGLNPSVANETDNDPTIRREIGFAKSWGCARLVKVNAYGWVSTDPKAMFEQKRKNKWDIVGPDNDHFIVEALHEVLAHGGTFLAAWGQNIEPFRQIRISEIIGEHAQCLAINKDGTPKHPLYIKADAKPRPWRLGA